MISSIGEILITSGFFLAFVRWTWGRFVELNKENQILRVSIDTLSEKQRLEKDGHQTTKNDLRVLKLSLELEAEKVKVASIRYDELEKRNDQVQGRNDKLLKDIDDLGKRIDGQDETIQKQRDLIKTQREEIDQLKTDSTENTKKVNKLETENNSKDGIIANQKKTILEQEALLEENQRKLGEAITERNKLERDLNQLRSELATLTEAMNKQSTHINTLQKQFDSVVLKVDAIPPTDGINGDPNK